MMRHFKCQPKYVQKDRELFKILGDTDKNLLSSPLAKHSVDWFRLLDIIQSANTVSANIT